MGKFVHMELNTSDVKGAKAFYKGVFGWKITDVKMEGGVYSMASTAAGEGIGGIMKNPAPDAPPAWLGYIGVDSVAKTVKKIEKKGGNVVHQMEIPNMGRLAVFIDPQGAACAIWEPMAPPPPEKKKAAKKVAKKKAAKKKK